MKTCLLLWIVIAYSSTTSAQDLDALFANGKQQEIVDLYKGASRTFDHNELEIVAASFDRLNLLPEEDEVLHTLVSSYPLFLTYTIPSNYLYFGNLISGGLMEKYEAAIITQYQSSIKDTAAGRTILSAFYRDQIVRQKFEDNKHRKKDGLIPKWDSARLMRDWAGIASVNRVLIERIIHDYSGFPSKANIGLIGTNALFILMQHLDTGYRGTYDHLLLNAACRKDIAMGDYAMFKTMTLVRTHQIPDSLFQNTLDSLSAIKCK
jgi:hypothetical protein